jgi:hypothetical protein
MSIGDDIINRVAVQIAGDGFQSLRPGLFLKVFDGGWRGWLTIDQSDYQLGPVVGVLNEGLKPIFQEARKQAGLEPASDQSGPPLIMINFNVMAKAVPDCLPRISWDYKGTGKDLGEPLKPEVADDLVYCLRKVGYPYIESLLSYDAVLDEIVRGHTSPGITYYLPIILLLRNRPDCLDEYTRSEQRHMRANGGHMGEELARNFGDYVEALRGIVEPLPGRWTNAEVDARMAKRPR